MNTRAESLCVQICYFIQKKVIGGVLFRHEFTKSCAQVHEMRIHPTVQRRATYKIFDGVADLPAVVFIERCTPSTTLCLCEVSPSGACRIQFTKSSAIGKLEGRKVVAVIIRLCTTGVNTRKNQAVCWVGKSSLSES